MKDAYAIVGKGNSVVCLHLVDPDARRLEADALIHASLACLDVALAHFTLGQDASFSKKLDAAFEALRLCRTR